MLNLLQTCSSFLSSFSLTVFIKFFLIQKSKSRANLNHKEGKQEETTIDQSTNSSGSWGKNLSLGILYLGAVFSFPLDNLSEAKLCRRKIIRKAIFLGAQFPGNTVRGHYFWGNCWGVISGAFFRGAIIQGAIVRGGQFFSGQLFGHRLELALQGYVS